MFWTPPSGLACYVSIGVNAISIQIRLALHPSIQGKLSTKVQITTPPTIHTLKGKEYGIGDGI